MGDIVVVIFEKCHLWPMLNWKGFKGHTQGVWECCKVLMCGSRRVCQKGTRAGALGHVLTSPALCAFFLQPFYKMKVPCQEYSYIVFFFDRTHRLQTKDKTKTQGKETTPSPHKIQSDLENGT